MEQGYDLIGDIHGHADELKELLEKMEYNRFDGCYRHETRKVIFLGDFIDRGTQQKEVLDTVMAMVENDAALAVMGNHEFNALAFHSKHPDNAGTWLRPRENKNIQQHLAFLNEYLGKGKKDDLERVIDFFFSLPLWLELDGLRVVHACWEPNYIERLKPLLNPDNTLTPDLLVEASTKNSMPYDAVELLLKGHEYDLPDDNHFFDKDGHRRDAVRTQWWKNEDTTVGEVTMPPGTIEGEAAKIAVRAHELVGYGADEKPVFLGHYWHQGDPVKLATNVACLDYSVAHKDGKLVAYRWSGEKAIDDGSFVFV